jgi:hypothetical protein
LRPAEGPFGVNHPVLTKQRPQKSMEGFLLGEPFQAAREHQFREPSAGLRTGSG